MWETDIGSIAFVIGNFFFGAKEPPIFRVSYSIFAHKPMIFTLLFLSRQPFHAQFDSVASCIEFKFNLANQLER